eukprot:13745-Heterococcus_DN1.PRE.4
MQLRSSQQVTRQTVTVQRFSNGHFTKTLDTRYHCCCLHYMPSMMLLMHSAAALLQMSSVRSSSAVGAAAVYN